MTTRWKRVRAVWTYCAGWVAALVIFVGFGGAMLLAVVTVSALCGGCDKMAMKAVRP